MGIREIISEVVVITMNYFAGVGCSPETKRFTSALAGGLVAYSGLDTTFAGFGFSPEVHYALAGIGVDIACRGSGALIDPMMETGLSALAGYAGASAAKMLFRK